MLINKLLGMRKYLVTVSFESFAGSRTWSVLVSAKCKAKAIDQGMKEFRFVGFDVLSEPKADAREF